MEKPKKEEIIQKQTWLVKYLTSEARVNKEIENIYLRLAKDVLDELESINE